mmetsp:Transcript_31787/g.59753  ORF Transcript_31787/g.59753 Transcript_31787/m.59753 type:complete len:537 (-) Transcript_31787:1309-2919(-)
MRPGAGWHASCVAAPSTPTGGAAASAATGAHASRAGARGGGGARPAGGGAVHHRQRRPRHPALPDGHVDAAVHAGSLPWAGGVLCEEGRRGVRAPVLRGGSAAAARVRDRLARDGAAVRRGSGAQDGAAVLPGGAGARPQLPGVSGRDGPSAERAAPSRRRRAVLPRHAAVEPEVRADARRARRLANGDGPAGRGGGVLQRGVTSGPGLRSRLQRSWQRLARAGPLLGGGGLLCGVLATSLPDGAEPHQHAAPALHHRRHLQQPGQRAQAPEPARPSSCLLRTRHALAAGERGRLWEPGQRLQGLSPAGAGDCGVPARADAAARLPGGSGQPGALAAVRVRLEGARRRLRAAQAGHRPPAGAGHALRRATLPRHGLPAGRGAGVAVDDDARPPRPDVGGRLGSGSPHPPAARAARGQAPARRLLQLRHRKPPAVAPHGLGVGDARPGAARDFCVCPLPPRRLALAPARGAGDGALHGRLGAISAAARSPDPGLGHPDSRGPQRLHQGRAHGAVRAATRTHPGVLHGLPGDHGGFVH